jgi:tetratricopeptide (TPR) repeat protein
MVKAAWRDILGWTEEQAKDLRSSGYDYLRQGHYKEAVVFFEALVVLNPQNFFDRFTLGALYLQMADYERALAQIEAALQLNPQNWAARLNRAKVLLSLGRLHEGVVLARELITCPDPKIRDLSEALVMGYG